MYFLEFLETCTIVWVLVCEGGVGVGKWNLENAFFEFFLRRLSTHPTPGVPCIPRRWRPQPQRTRNDCTAQTAAQAVPEPGRGKYQGRPRNERHAPGRWTRCTGLRPIPDRPRWEDRTGGGARGRSNSSIVRILIALSQAWYIDSNMNKYHKDILLFLVIVNCYLSIDTPFY